MIPFPKTAARLPRCEMIRKHPQRDSRTVSNAAVSSSLADLLVDLGGISADRIKLDPPPGSATFDDLVAANEGGAMCEWVDGTLVEKAMGWMESVIGLYVGELLGKFSRRHNLGFVSGADGFLRIMSSTVRGPDVAFVSWERIPDKKFPEAKVPEIVPDLAVEVLSTGNTRAEMARKRREYFHAGVKLVWMIDPRQRSVAIYTSSDEYTVLDETEKLTGGEVLPGLEIELAEQFAELDRKAT
jgi:Uma2 family endonuclease